MRCETRSNCETRQRKLARKLLWVLSASEPSSLVLCSRAVTRRAPPAETPESLKSYPPAEWQCGGSERCGLLADKEAGLARRLDRGLLDGGDGGVEFFHSGGGDGDQAGVAQDAVPGGEVGFLLEHVVVLGSLRGVLDLADLRALGMVGAVLHLLLADVRSEEPTSE